MCPNRMDWWFIRFLTPIHEKAYHNSHTPKKLHTATTKPKRVISSSILRMIRLFFLPLRMFKFQIKNSYRLKLSFDTLSLFIIKTYFIKGNPANRKASYLWLPLINNIIPFGFLDFQSLLYLLHIIKRTERMTRRLELRPHQHTCSKPDSTNKSAMAWWAFQLQSPNSPYPRV